MQDPIQHYLTSMKQVCPEIKEEHLYDFAQALYIKSFPSKTEIYGLHALHNTIGFVVEGLVRCYYFDPKGEEKTAWFIQEDEFATDYPSFLSNTPSDYIFKTTEKTTLVFLPKEAIYAAYEQHNSIQKYGRLIAEHIIQQLQERLQPLLCLSAKERYLQFIHQNEPLLDRISIKHMASLIGVERQSLTRIRKQLYNQK
ncbi:MAG: Crp/Fnr family transcriptional regulator [Aureispira sp.]